MSSCTGAERCGVRGWGRGARRVSRAEDPLSQGLQFAWAVDDRANAVGCIEVPAWIAMDEGAPRRATSLMGASEALARAGCNPSITYLNLLVRHDRCKERARGAIGDRAFAAESGRVSECGSRRDAPGYALGE